MVTVSAEVGEVGIGEFGVGDDTTTNTVICPVRIDANIPVRGEKFILEFDIPGEFSECDK